MEFEQAFKGGGEANRHARVRFGAATDNCPAAGAGPATEPRVEPAPPPAPPDDLREPAEARRPRRDTRSVPPSPPVPPEPQRAWSVEERLGGDWTVWIGGVALALGGLLLVRYAIDEGYLGPAARCVIGLVFGLALAGAGEALRRREKTSGAPTQIPAVLTASGAVAAFGAVYAAHAVYGFVGPAAAFLALGVLALATILAAALHGPWLAGLGLVGAGAAPALVTAPEPNLWPVVAYLAIVCAAAYALADLRGWRWLGRCAAAIGGAWAIAMALDDNNYYLHAAFTQMLISTALATLFLVYLPRFARSGEPATIDRDASLVHLGLGAAAVAVIFAAQGRFDLPSAAMIGVMIAGLSHAGARIPAAAPLTLIAGALACAALALWERRTVLGPPPSLLFVEPENPTAFIAFAVASGCVVAALGAGDSRSAGCSIARRRFSMPSPRPSRRWRC